MKLIILGSRGMLGTDMASFLQHTITKFDLTDNILLQPRFKDISLSLIGVTSKDLDISNHSQTYAFITGHKPDVIINCAAYTDVDGCEKEEKRAFDVNAIGVRNIALAAKKCNARVVHISTDYIFDGLSEKAYTEEDKPNPLSVYGRSKLKGEEYLKEVGNDFLIIRTAWLYGRHGEKNYVKKMLQLARERAELDVVDDQIGSPTYTVDLSEAIWILIKENHTGVFHVANSGSCSRYEWSKRIFELAGLDVAVHPIQSKDFKRPAIVPPHAVLDCKKFTSTTCFRMRNWDEALQAYFR